MEDWPEGREGKEVSAGVQKWAGTGQAYSEPEWGRL